MSFPTFLTYALATLACLAGLALLLMALWHIRVSGSAHGAWDGTLDSPHAAHLRLEYGFPGFMRRHDWPHPDNGAEADADAATAAPDTQATETRRPSPASPPAPHRAPSAASPHVSDAPEAGSPTEPPGNAAGSTTDESGAREDAETRTANEPDPAPSGKADPNRWRKALFRLATDGPAWTGIARYLRRMLRLAGRLLHARIDLTLTHPDPALLGRTAGYWYAFTGPTPLRHLRTDFRFCAPHPAVTLRAQGGFSALELAGFVAAAVLTFPWLRLARRMRRSWTHREPQGWRRRLYRMLQSA